jgi:hypothetical protein
LGNVRHNAMSGIITYGIRAQGLGVSLLHLRHLGIFAITFFLQCFRRNAWRIFIRQIKVRWVQNSAPEALYFQRYNLYKIGFWNHPELSHCGIFAIKNFCNVSDPKLRRIFTKISKVSVVKSSASGSS